MRQYRIGLDARPLSTPVSGVGRLIAELLIAFPDKESYRFILYTNKPIHKTHNRILELPNIEIPKFSGILASKGGTFYNLVLPLHIKKEKLDLFWGSQQVLPPFLSNKIPTILTYCDLVLYLYPQTMRLIARIQQLFFQKYSIHRSNYILSISEQTRQDVNTKFNYPIEKSDVTYPGIDLNLNQKYLNCKPSKQVQDINYPFLLSVSTIEPRKNYPFLLEVYKKYRNQLVKNKLKWIILGKRGWESESFYQELEKEIDHYHDILHISNADDIDLHHLYSKCQIFLMASIYEGFGIPLLEAISYKKPCIVSDIPVFHEIGEDKITYLPTNKSKKNEGSNMDTVELWSNKIIEIQNKKTTVEINLKKFYWKESAKKTKEIFDKFLNGDI